MCSQSLEEAYGAPSVGFWGRRGGRLCTRFLQRPPIQVLMLSEAWGDLASAGPRGVPELFTDHPPALRSASPSSTITTNLFLSKEPTQSL